MYFSAGGNDPYCYAPTTASQKFVTSGSVTQFYGLCEVGFQGLMHDEESGVIYNRRRDDDTLLERFMEEEPYGAQYFDGPNLYQYERSAPDELIDPMGLGPGTVGGRPIIGPPPPPPPGPPPYTGPYVNTYNGCGSRESGHIYSGTYWSFEPACDDHDQCYGRCGANKNQCDKNLRDGALAAWNDFWNGLSTAAKLNPVSWLLFDSCVAQANAFYAGVQVGGGSAFQSAQQAACKCKK